MLKSKANKRKNRIEETTKTTKITKFFHSTENDPNIKAKQPPKPKIIRKGYYKKCVEKSCSKQIECVQQKCINMKTEAANNLKRVKEKRDQTLRALEMVDSMLKKKDEKIRVLRANSQSKNPSNQSTDQNNLYADFRNDFDENDLAKLRSIDGSKKSDATFIRFSIQFMYKNESTRLKTISVTGRNRSGQQKVPMSPKKINTLKRIFSDRLKGLNLGDTERTNREAKLNTHIGRAISNESNSKKSELKELNDEINSVLENK